MLPLVLFEQFFELPTYPKRRLVYPIDSPKGFGKRFQLAKRVCPKFVKRRKYFDRLPFSNNLDKKRRTKLLMLKAKYIFLNDALCKDTEYLFSSRVAFLAFGELGAVVHLSIFLKLRELKDCFKHRVIRRDHEFGARDNGICRCAKCDELRDFHLVEIAGNRNTHLGEPRLIQLS